MNSHIKKHFKYYVLLFLLLSAVFVWLPVFGFGRSGDLEAVFLDVGQGDAILINSPSECPFCPNRQILIDAGPGSNILAPLSEAMPFYDRSIDLIVLSHPQYDHISGFVEVLKRYKVDNILITGVNYDIRTYEKIKQLAKEKGVNIVYAKTGQYADLGKGAILQILYPFENLKGKTVRDVNDTSIIAKITYGENSFLFTGDGTKREEKELLKYSLDLKSDVLKVGHHGSKNSSSEEFLKAVSAKTAVIQVSANNSYGHPNQIVLDRLQNINARIFRTDLSGSITVSSDGENIKVK